MKVFLDTNILIDFVGNRQDFFKDASLLFDLARKKKLTIVISSLSFVNAAYTLKKYIGKEHVMPSLQKISEICEISRIDSFIIKTALKNAGQDFEDTIQTHSAKTEKCDIIITRDKMGFALQDIEVQTPGEFIKNCIEKGN